MKIIKLLAVTIMMVATISLYAMEGGREKERETVTKEVEVKVPEGLEIPAEVLIEIIMNILPSTVLLNTIDYNKAGDALVEAMQKIMKSLNLGHFSPRGALFTTLIQHIKHHNYMPNVLQRAVESAAKKNELFIALILVKAGADLPYDMLYNSIRLQSEWGWQKFLALIKKLKEIGHIVNFNAMPYFDKGLDQGFTNPLVYLLTLLRNAKAYNDQTQITYLKATIEKLIIWAQRNGYLRNLLALDDEEQLNIIKKVFFGVGSLGKYDFFMNLISKYDKNLYEELLKKIPNQYPSGAMGVMGGMGLF
jgi:hypothetical protein